MRLQLFNGHCQCAFSISHITEHCSSGTPGSTPRFPSKTSNARRAFRMTAPWAYKSGYAGPFVFVLLFLGCTSPPFPSSPTYLMVLHCNLTSQCGTPVKGLLTKVFVLPGERRERPGARCLYVHRIRDSTHGLDDSRSPVSLQNNLDVGIILVRKVGHGQAAQTGLESWGKVLWVCGKQDSKSSMNINNLAVSICLPRARSAGKRPSL